MYIYWWIGIVAFGNTSRDGAEWTTVPLDVVRFSPCSVWQAVGIIPYSTHGNTSPPTMFVADSLANEESAKDRRCTYGSVLTTCVQTQFFVCAGSPSFGENRL